MRIGIDVREALNPKKTGKGLWTKGFLEELRIRGIPLTLFSNRSCEAGNEEQIVFPQNGFSWHCRTAWTLRKRPDITHYVSPTSYIVPSFLGQDSRMIPVVHDLIAFQKEPHDNKAVMIERMLLKKIVRSSALILTVSNATREDLLQKYPDTKAEKIVPVYAGPTLEHPPLSKPDGRTILSVGTLCPRKNQLRLIKAYASLPDELRKNYDLVLVGPRGWNDEEIVTRSRETPGVSWRSYVPDEEYSALLSKTVVLAFPSLYEGFGMPVLDALQRGIPVLTSERGSLREVADTAAVFSDPTDVSSIQSGLELLLTDQHLRRKLSREGPLQARKFSWKRTVNLFLEALKKT